MRKEKHNQQELLTFSEKREKERKKAKRKLYGFALLGLLGISTGIGVLLPIISQMNATAEKQVVHSELSNEKIEDRTALSVLDGSYEDKLKTSKEEKAKQEQQEMDAKVNEYLQQEMKKVTDEANAKLEEANRRMNELQQQIQNLSDANTKLLNENAQLRARTGSQVQQVQQTTQTSQTSTQQNNTQTATQSSQYGRIELPGNGN